MKKFINIKLWSLLIAVFLMIGNSNSVSAATNAPDEYGNVPFVLTNMFPGDSMAQEFTVKTHHVNRLVLNFHVELRPGYEKLAEVLMFKVELPEKNMLLYEGLLKDIPDVLEYHQPATEKEIIYRIEASLDTSVGNEYQGQELIADFSWWHIYEPSGGGGQNPPENPPVVEVTSPKTGDESNLSFYIILSAFSLVAILLILMRKKRTEEETNG